MNFIESVSSFLSKHGAFKGRSARSEYLYAILITFSIFSTQDVSAEWLITFESEDENTSTYIEADTIKKADDFIYYWTMNDFLNPVSDDVFSAQIYIQGDCKRSRVKTLSYLFFKRNMGRGEPDQQESQNKNWKYPAPGSFMLLNLNTACSLSD